MNRTYTYTCPHCKGHEFKVHAEVELPLVDRGEVEDDIDVGEPDSYDYGVDSAMQCTTCGRTEDIRAIRKQAALDEAVADFGKRISVSDWSLFDGIEVSPCTLEIDNSGGVQVEPQDENSGDAVMWSVYLHCVAGGVECYVDFATEDEANAEARALLAAHPELHKHGFDDPLWPEVRDYYGLDRSFFYGSAARTQHILNWLDRAEAKQDKINITESQGGVLYFEYVSTGRTAVLLRVPTPVDLMGAAILLHLTDTELANMLRFFSQLAFVQDTVATAKRHGFTYVKVT